jgi:hypothetical protein
MDMINRAAIIVIPKQPYVDWANSLDDDGPRLALNDPNWEYSIYLVRNVESDAAARNAVKRHFTEIFEHELASWDLDENAWPEKRDYRIFKKWFEVRASSIVLDFEKGWVDKEEFEG